MNGDTRPWYKKKRFIIFSALASILMWSGGFGGTATPPASSNTAATIVSQPRDVIDDNATGEDARTSDAIDNAPEQDAQLRSETSAASEERRLPPSDAEKIQPVETSQLSNDNHYINSGGESVHSPAYSPTIPEGASARCGDGTYSFSRSRRGTCSHHGGVAEWL
jgi:hypothetical protein